MRRTVNFFLTFLAVASYYTLNALNRARISSNPQNNIVSQNPFAGKSRGSMMNITTTTWRGLNVIKGKNVSKPTVFTLPQVHQQTKFKLVSNFCSGFLELINIGFKKAIIGQAPFNLAMKYNFDNAVSGVYPNYSIVLNNAGISNGNMEAPTLLELTSIAPYEIQVTWNAGIVGPGTSDSDICSIGFWDVENNKFACFPSMEARDAGSADCYLPADWEGSTAHVFIFFVSLTPGIISKTSYFGSYVVPGA